MLEKKGFWILLMHGLAALYILGIWMLMNGLTQQLSFYVIALLPVIHMLELPAAFKALAQQTINKPKTICMVIIFGFLWWVPASRGIFSAK